MDILVGKRQQGKTTHLIKMSAAGQGTIVAPTERSAKYIKDLAREMKLDIPEPIGFGTLVRTSPGRKGPYLFDELGGLLRGLGIETAILDDECNIEYLSGGPLHKGKRWLRRSGELQRISVNFPTSTSSSSMKDIGLILWKTCRPDIIGIGKRPMIF